MRFSILLLILPLLWCQNLYSQCSGGEKTPLTISASDLDFNGYYKSTNPTVWDADITVPTGIICTLAVDLSFYPDRGIYVEAGGVLIVEGASLTTCGDETLREMWNGIQVLGTANKSQVIKKPSSPFNELIINPDQGVVILKSNPNNSADKTIIEKAKVGVRAGDANGNNGGAVVRAANATFRNCEYGIVFQPYTDYRYPERNLSYFTDCTFKWDNLWFISQHPNSPHLTGAQSFEAHVYLNKVNGILFFGNNKFTNELTTYDYDNWYNVSGHYIPTEEDFIYLRPSTSGGSYTKYAARGEGIRSLNSSFYLMAGSPCNSLTWPYDASNAGCVVCKGAKNEFTNLNRGINAYTDENNIGGTQLGITGSTFTNCHDGAVLQEVDNVFINRCDFIATDNFKEYVEIYDPFGIKMLDCERFDISENTFDYEISEGADMCYSTEGALVAARNSQGTRNRIYKNDYAYSNGYSHCPIPKYGTWMINNNPNLEVHCNNYNLDPYMPGYDWLISNFDNNSSNTLMQQGNSTYGANNTWTKTGDDIHNIVTEDWTTDINYYYKYTSNNSTNLKNPDINGEFVGGIYSPGASHLNEIDITGTDNNTCEHTSYCKFFSSIGDEDEYAEIPDNFTEDDMFNTFGFVEGIDDFFENDEIPTSINNKKKPTIFGSSVAYPNPSTAYTYIEYNMQTAAGSGKLEVLDINGKVVFTKVLQNSKGTEAIDNKNLKPGIYFYKITFGSTSKTGKIIKQ